MDPEISHFEHDLFLLMLNLSQVSEQSKIISTFIEAMNSIWPNADIQYHPKYHSRQTEAMPISTVKSTYGAITIKAPDISFSSEHLALIRNSVRMLAVFLEHREQDRLLTQEKSTLEKAVKKRTRDLMKTNLELEKEINERLEVERNLLETKQLLGNAFDNASIGMILLLPDGTFYQVNKSFCQMVGFEEEELLGMNFQDITHPEDYQIGSDVIKRMLSGKVRYGNIEKRYITKNGQTIHVRLMSSLLKNNEGNPHYFFTQAQDITESKLAEIALRESEHYLKEAQSIAGLAYWKLDQKTRAMSGSEALYRLLEITPQSSDVNDFIAKIAPEERQKRKYHIEKGMQQGDHWDAEIRLKFNGQREKIIHSIGKPVLDKDGKVTEIIGIVQDISEQKKKEQELQKAKLDLENKVEERTRELKKAKEAAEFADKAKSAFLANISHELRNPMHHILGYSKFGTEKADTVGRDKLYHYFSQIRKSGKRLMYLLNDLLDLSKMEAGKVDYQFDYHNVWRIVFDAVDEFRGILQKKKLNLVMEDPKVDTKVHCDEFRIGQVIRNLLSNAVKFTPEGKCITIRFAEGSIIGNYQSIPALKIMLEDQGIGIPPNELKSVFEKFTQSSATNSDSGGTGLGLAICNEILIAHGGKIRASNNASGGATFSVLIPYRDESSLDDD